MTISKTTIHIIGNRLPNKWLQKAEKKLKGKYSRGYISRVKNGHAFNEEIMKVIISIKNDWEKKVKALEAKAEGKEVSK